MPDPIQSIRSRLVEALDWQDAHPSFDRAVANMPEPARGVRPEGLPYSAWELVEHLRLAQWDILEFCRNPDYAEPDFPSDYWPDTPAPPTRDDWERSIDHFRRDREALQALVADPDSDLLARIPHGGGQTLLREAVLVVDHSAYHIGQLVLVRRLLGTWPT